MENIYCSKQKSIFTLSQSLSIPKINLLNSNMSKEDKLQENNNLNKFPNLNKSIESLSIKEDLKSSNMNSNRVENMDPNETVLTAISDTASDVQMQTNFGMYNNACESISDKYMTVTAAQFNQNDSKSSYDPLPCNISEAMDNSEVLEVKNSKYEDSTNKIKSFLNNNSLGLPSTSQEFSCKRANLNSYSLPTQQAIKRHKPDGHFRLSNESSNVDYAPQITFKRYEIGNNIGEKAFLTSSSSRSLNASDSISFFENTLNSLHKDFPPHLSTANQKDSSTISQTSPFCNELNRNSSSCKSNTSPTSHINKDCGHSDIDDLFSVKKIFRNVRKTRSESSQIFLTHSNSSDSILTLKGKHKHGLLSVFIEDFFKTTHPNLCLSSSVCQRLELFLRDILYRIGDEAEILMTLSDNKSFNLRVLKYAIKLCLQHIKMKQI